MGFWTFGNSFLEIPQSQVYKNQTEFSKNKVVSCSVFETLIGFPFGFQKTKVDWFVLSQQQYKLGTVQK